MTRRSLGYAYVNYLNSSDGMCRALGDTPNFDFTSFQAKGPLSNSTIR
jgi:hypothetical protein